MVVGACGKGKETPSKTKVTGGNNTKPIKVDDNATKPVKELTPEEKVVGEYEPKKDGGTERVVFLDNGIAEGYLNGKKREEEFKWSIVKGEIHVLRESGDIAVYRINKDGSFTVIARIHVNGKREEAPKEEQETFKKIK